MSNLTKRVLMALIGIPLILGSAYLGGIYFLIFSILVSSLALWEFCSMFEKKGYAPLRYLGIVISAAMIIISGSDSKYFELIFFAAILISSVEIFRKEKNPMNSMILNFGIVYIVFPFIMLNEMTASSFNHIVIFIFTLIWTCDTAAYFGGRIFGKNLLSAISPKKTWEGAVSGFIFTVIISLIIHFIFPEKLRLTDAVALGLIVGIFSQVGDLFESLIKRYCGVKDSSNIIPGHGGILDRFDSLLFVTPVIFVYFNIIAINNY